VNVVGGLRINEPAADLALALAIASSFRNLALPADLAAIGEVGLSGELRAVGHLSRRLHEAHKLGFGRCIVPSTRQTPGAPEGMKLIAARSLPDALALAFALSRKQESQH
jgi:DNA repair protein RadA/Sms